MIEFIIRRFIKNYEDTINTSVNNTASSAVS